MESIGQSLIRLGEVGRIHQVAQVELGSHSVRLSLTILMSVYRRSVDEGLQGLIRTPAKFHELLSSPIYLLILEELDHGGLLELLLDHLDPVLAGDLLDREVVQDLSGPLLHRLHQPCASNSQLRSFRG